MQFTYQTEKEIRSDVLVCGGGVAGVVAAIAAAREGAKTVLVEKSGMIGGMATGGLVGPFMTCYSPDGKRQLVKGIFDELIRRLEAKGGAVHPSKTGEVSAYACFIPKKERHNNVTPFHPGYMSIVMAQMLKEAGVSVYLNTSIVEVLMDKEDPEKICGITAYDGTKFCLFSADIVIDATGDGIVAVKAGAEFIQGTPEDPKEVQPMSLFFTIHGTDDRKIEEYLDHSEGPKYLCYHEMIEKDRAEGKFNIPRNKIGLYHMVDEGEWRLNTTRVQGYDPADPDDVTKGYFECLDQVDFLMDYFRKCPGLENAKLGQIGSLMGVRESRRIKGAYYLTKSDLARGKNFEDTVALCSYPVDMHPSKGSAAGASREEDLKIADIYAIPYRIMVPESIRNLLVAGRCVSADREALAAIRVMAPVMAMGEAAGVAAAMAAKEKTAPKDIDVTKLRGKLREKNCEIDL